MQLFTKILNQVYEIWWKDILFLLSKYWDKKNKIKWIEHSHIGSAVEIFRFKKKNKRMDGIKKLWAVYI